MVKEQNWLLNELNLGPHLPERLDLGVHDEVELAEFAAAGVRTLDPLLQARLVHVTQGTGAVAGGDERVVRFTLTVADATHVTLQKGTEMLRTQQKKKKIHHQTVKSHRWAFHKFHPPASHCQRMKPSMAARSGDGPSGAAVAEEGNTGRLEAVKRNDRLVSLHCSEKKRWEILKLI